LFPQFGWDILYIFSFFFPTIQHNSLSTSNLPPHDYVDRRLHEVRLHSGRRPGREDYSGGGAGPPLIFRVEPAFTSLPHKPHTNISSLLFTRQHLARTMHILSQPNRFHPTQKVVVFNVFSSPVLQTTTTTYCGRCILDPSYSSTQSLPIRTHLSLVRLTPHLYIFFRV
jgi:hypothetical protein